MTKLSKIVFLCSILSASYGHAETSGGIIIGKFANVRDLPTVINSKIIRTAYKGTALKILDKTAQMIKIGDVEGHWYKVELIEEGEQGWIFDQYVALEGDPQIAQYFQWVTSSLYYYRSDLDELYEEIKDDVSLKNTLDPLKKYKPRFLNYIAYRLLAERNALAIPVLIAFMDPAHKEKNSEDANYLFTWEILERLTPKVLITNDYRSFRYWWQRNYGSAENDFLTLPTYELATIFKKIHENENQVYRKVTNPPRP